MPGSVSARKGEDGASGPRATVYLGMSGGVDSSVSAILLKEQGYHVVGVYMKNWSEDLPGMKCPWAEDLADAKRVAVKLGIDFEVFDFEKQYRQKVVDYMLEEFAKGNTPNPDIMCNQEIKFKLFYDVARERGADYIATGHYARIGRGVTRLGGTPAERHSARQGEDGAAGPRAKAGPRAELLRAVDESKDQTYFLYRISEEALEHTIFPIGEMLKTDVKKLAAKHGLDNAYKKESMGVCFVGEVGMKDFLKKYLKTKPGEIRDIDTDKVVGAHEGAIFYTIGQRKGLRIGGGIPYYVVKKDIAKNIVYVSQNLNNDNLWTKELTLKDVFIRGELAKLTPSSHNLKVRLRHRAPLIPATINIRKNEAKVAFENEIKAPASGQSVVFYDGEVCLGGGIII